MGDTGRDRSVRIYQHRKPHWARQWVETEVIGEKAAFEQAELDRQAALRDMPVTDVHHQTRLPLIGGPLDGGTFRVPTMLMRRGPAQPEFEIPIPHAQTAALYLPEATVRAVHRAVYRLDKQARALRFERLVNL